MSKETELENQLKVDVEALEYYEKFYPKDKSSTISWQASIARSALRCIARIRKDPTAVWWPGDDEKPYEKIFEQYEASSRRKGNPTIDEEQRRDQSE